jgi:hypothetical protein
MAKFETFTRPCGKNEAPGTLETGYLTYVSEFDAMPQTRYAIAEAATPGSALPGDTKILDEPWDFAAAPSGEGYFRTFPILINTGEVTNVEEGEIGGKTMMNEANFFIPGNDSIVKEAVERLRAGSGCCLIMVPDKSKRYQVVGSKDHPAYFDITEPGGTGGARVGYAIRAYSDSGAINLEYDADTHGIDLVANV